MYFEHASEIWQDFPELAAGAMSAGQITTRADVDAPVDRWAAAARSRLAQAAEAGFPEVQAWRRAFARMGLKPTQYRCASESLLRRLRKEGSLPRIHPLVDLCNAASAAYGIPVAVLDTSRIARFLQVRRATGEERYETFSGATEHPAAGEVTFVDAAGRAHARRWTNRQSGHSAVGEATTEALIVAEALHESGREDVRSLLDGLAEEVDRAWSVAGKPVLLTSFTPRFEM
jgi:DNA/RNA-binding domain of Phe-tRNA-synthetase-like protein